MFVEDITGKAQRTCKIIWHFVCSGLQGPVLSSALYSCCNPSDSGIAKEQIGSDMVMAVFIPGSLFTYSIRLATHPELTWTQRRIQ